MLSWLKRHHSDSVASNRVAAFRVRLPDFHHKLGPASDCLAFVMEVERVVPDRELVNFVPHFFVSFPRVAARQECPVDAAPYLELAEDARRIESGGARNLADEMHLRSIGVDRHCLNLKLQPAVLLLINL